MGDCMVQGAWWPTVLIAVVIGIGIGLFVCNWFWRDSMKQRARYLHPSWSEYGSREDGGGRGEMWEQPGLWDG